MEGVGCDQDEAQGVKAMMSVEFIRATLRLSTPLLLSSLGGSFMHHAGVPNVAMDGMMLIGAFAAYAVSMVTHSSLLGLLAAMLAAVLVSLIYAYFVLNVKADVFAVGIALNIFLAGVAAYVLRGYFHQESVLISTEVQMLPVLEIPWLQGNSGLNTLFNNYSLLIPLALLLFVIGSVVIYRTPFGYWVRAAGLNPQALETSGKNAVRVQLAAFVISGAFCGLAGAHLSIGYLGLFALSIVAGRGFIALAVVLFGNGHPLKVLLASLLFGAAEAASLRIPVETLAPQFSLMMPYIITILAIVIMSVSTRRKWVVDS